MDRFANDGKLGQGFTSADDLIEVDKEVVIGQDLLLLVLVGF